MLKNTKADTNTAWPRLTTGICLLNTRPSARLRYQAEDTFARDEELWFRALVTNRYNYLVSHAELTPLQFEITAVSGPVAPVFVTNVPTLTANVAANGNSGVGSVWLYFRDKPYGRFIVRQMFDDGAHDDGAANDGVFGAVTTNYPAGHKITNAEVDLTGHYLSDEPNNPRKWQFPAGTKIPADGHLLVWADEDGKATPGLHASFKLDKSGEQLSLTDTDVNLNAVLDSITFGAQQPDASYGRSAADAAVWIFMQPTPGEPNQ